MTPPRAAERLVRHAVPADAAGLSVVGDLRQEYEERTRVHGRWPASRWYWRQAWSLWWWALRHPESSHHRPRGGVMFDVLTDVRDAFRAARKAGSQTLLIIVTLALAIGATTIGFTFLDLAVLRGLPVVDSDRAVFLFAVDPRTGNDRSWVTLGDFVDFRSRSRTTEKLSAFEQSRATLLGQGQPLVLDVVRATGDFFAAMGQSARIGRVLGEGDDRPGAPPVVVLSHTYWQHVGGDSGVLGQVLQLGPRAHVIVGVAQPELEFGSLAIVDAWLPLTLEPGVRTPRRTRVIGRLAAGTDFQTAAAEFAAIGDALAREYPMTNAGWRARLTPISEAAGSRNFWVIIAVFTLAVVLVVAIACANVANVLLVRATSLGRDVAIRTALGASRLRIMRSLVMEGLLLSLASGVLAVPLAEGLLRIIRSIDGEPALQQLWLDWHELAFIATVALVAPVVFAIGPARQLVRADVRTALASGGQRTGTTGRRSRSLLVSAQVALAVVMLITSGLAIRTALNISGADNGLYVEQALKFEVELDEETYPDLRVVAAALDDLRGRLVAIAGVRGVGVFDRLPVIQGGSTASLAIDGEPGRPGDGSGPWALVGRTRAGSLDAVGIRLIEGRDLPPDQAAAGRVALVSREAARRYYGNPASALGKRLSIVHPDMAPDTREVIGVVTDISSSDIELGPQPYVWIELGQARHIGFVLSAAQATHLERLPHAVREEVRSILPMTPVERLERYSVALDRMIASDLVIIGMLAGFSALALMMAAVGLYAVIAYSAGQRRAEFGTRVALGARTVDVIGLVVGEAGRMLVTGLSVGLLGGLLVGYGMRHALIGVDPIDLVTLTTVVGLLTLVTLVASLVPALRASRVDLVSSLRAE